MSPSEQSRYWAAVAMLRYSAGSRGSLAVGALGTGAGAVDHQWDSVPGTAHTVRVEPPPNETRRQPELPF
jgi:hypothetical protein